MATLYLKAGGGNWTAAATWSNTGSGGGDSSGPPTAADDAIAETGSGNVTIDSGAVCRSFNCTSGTGNYAGTITHTAGVTINVGDGTAGAGNVAWKFSAGLTYTLGNAATSAITFISTSATQQDVDYDNKTTGNVTYNAASNGSWKQVSAHTASSTATVTLTKGTFTTNGQTCSWGAFNSSNTNVRSLTLGASSITITSATSWNTATVTNLTFSGASSTITITSASTNFQGGSLTYGTLIYTGSAAAAHQLGGANTFSVLTVTGTAAKTDIFLINGNQTITGTLNINGNSATNRVLMTGSSGAGIGTNRTLTVTGATVNITNCDIRDITMSPATDLSGITGNSGDCGGNSGITFTTAATQTATGTTGFTWSTHGWTSRVPLPQDDVVIANAFSAGQTVVLDMPRAGKSINFTGATNTPTWQFTTAPTLYGSLNTTNVGTHTSGGSALTFEGRGSFTLTSGTMTWTGGITIAMVGGTLTQQDALTGGASQLTLTLTAGTYNANGFNFTGRRVLVTGTLTRALTMGTGTWTLGTSSAESAWNATTVTGLTLTSTGSTIVISDTGANIKTFIGGGLTYNNITISGGGSGSVDFTGANTFNVFTISAPKTVRFTAATTTTVTTWMATGSLGNLITISSLTAAQHTLSKASGTVSSNYLHLTNSNATGGATWYAGSASTDNGGNAGWIFSDAPATGVTRSNLLMMGI